MNPCFETASALARAIRNGKLTSREATEAHLERIARLNGPINALVVVDREGALKAARAADRGRGKEGRQARPAARRADHHQGSLRRGGPAHHLEPSAAQGQCRQDRRDPGGAAARGRRGDPGQDQRARAVRRLSDRQPAVRHHEEPLGRAARGAGGSTGGGAVAVAARLSPLELGSDIGGSVRNPAHYNGIFSLKPTEWRVPSRGHVPDLPGVTRAVRYMGVFGPLARSVDDLETALRIIAGPDGYEAEAPPVPIGPTPKLKADGPADRGARDQSAGQGVAGHGEGRAGDREAPVARPAPR